MDAHETKHPGSRQDLMDRLRLEIDEMGWRNMRLVEDMLRPHGLTFAQAMVLTFLQRFGPDLEMSRIAAQTGLPASTITSIMDRLVNRDLAERHPGTNDRRRITGSITAEGRDMLETLQTQRDESLADVLAPFSDDELRILQKLVDRIASLSEHL